MSDPDPLAWPGIPDREPDRDKQASDDPSLVRYRARHGDAAPSAYPQAVAPGEPRAAVEAEVDPAAGPLQLRPASADQSGPLPLWPDRDATAGDEEVASSANGRAGRNLPAAIAVGLSLAALAVAPLFLWKPAFVLVVMAAVVGATWEMVRALRVSGANPPLVPLLLGGAAMCVLAWFGAAEALTLGLAATAVAALVWRLADGPAGYQRDAGATLLIAVYVPFLAGFMVLLAHPSDGAWRVLAALVGVVFSDTGGYVAGVFLGRHPMAPSVSPKKSWEGLAGSLVAAGAGSALVFHYLMHVQWWWGVLFGLAVAAASVLGDLAESLLKRDLGIKDMSNLLPGHGGFMDRFDSILFAAPTAYAVLALVAPATG